jgi:hypothetical protein
MSASLTVTSCAIAANGKTLTFTISGATGALTPSSGITGVTCTYLGNIYQMASATVSGTTVTATLAFPVPTGTVTTSVSTSSNLQDSAGTPNTIAASQTGLTTTNSSTAGVLAVPMSNANFQRYGDWPAAVSSQGRNLVAALQAEFDIGFTGTDIAVVAYTNFVSTCGVMVDGPQSQVASVSCLNNAAWSVIPLATGLAQATHQLYASSFGFQVDNGTTSGSGNATLLIAGATRSVSAPTISPSLVDNTVVSSANISTEGCITIFGTVAGATVPYASCGQGFRFAAQTTHVGLYGLYYGTVTTGCIALYCDGVLISEVMPGVGANGLPAAGTYGLTRVILSTKCDGSQVHEYQVVGGGGMTGNQVSGFYTYSIETDSGVAAVAHSALSVLGDLGESNCANYEVNDFRIGDLWQTSRALGMGMSRYGFAGWKSSDGLANYTNLSPNLASCIIYLGSNDVTAATAIGNTTTSGTYIYNVYTLLGDVRTFIGAGKPIIYRDMYPVSGINGTSRTTYNNAVTTAFNAYVAANPSDTKVFHWNTDAWIDGTNDVFSDLGLHLKLSGYTKVANKQIPLMLAAQGTASYSIATTQPTGFVNKASAPITVALSNGATFTGVETITLTSSDTGAVLAPSVGSPGTGAVTVTPTAGTNGFTFTFKASALGSPTITPTSTPDGGNTWKNPSALTMTVTTPRLLINPFNGQ